MIPASEPRRTKILLLGLKRSGKTSAFEVVFRNYPTKQLRLIEATREVAKHQVDSVVPLEIWDCPGSIPVDQLIPLQQFASVIFFIDMVATDKSQPFVPKLVEYVAAFSADNLDIRFEVFAHKCESLQEVFRMELFGWIQTKVLDQVLDLPLPQSATDDPADPAYFDPEQMIQFHLTSSQDYSIHEAFSKVLHKLLEPMSYLEDLLNIFCANSQLAKAFLFDINTRLYIATDDSPVDKLHYSLCCDYLQVVRELAPIYSEQGSQSSHCISGAVQLSPDTTLAFWQVTRDFAVLAILQTSVFQTRRGLMEYNIVFLRDGVREILHLQNDVRTGVAPALEKVLSDGVVL